MTNPFYNHTNGVPAAETRGVSQIIRNEFDLVDAGFASAAADIAVKATINSPAFTGTPTAPTATAGLSTDQLATTAFVQSAVVGGGSVPSPSGQNGKVLYANAGTAGWTDTKPIAETLTNKTLALGYNTISGTLAQFNAACTDGDFASLTGAETLTNKSLASPALTGTPTAPTAAVGTKTTQIATTAYVIAARPAFSAF